MSQRCEIEEEYCKSMTKLSSTLQAIPVSGYPPLYPQHGSSLWERRNLGQVYGILLSAINLRTEQAKNVVNVLKRDICAAMQRCFDDQSIIIRAITADAKKLEKNYIELRDRMADVTRFSHTQRCCAIEEEWLHEDRTGSREMLHEIRAGERPFRSNDRRSTPSSKPVE
jgi:hypothetical protein